MPATSAGQPPGAGHLTARNASSAEIDIMLRLALPLVLVFASFSTAMAGNWPAWRGPSGTGISEERNVPTEWSATENVTWKIDLTEPGNSTPIVWSDRLFMTTQLDGGKQRALQCIDRANGKILWQQSIAYDEPEPSHKTNPYCSASPVTDGKVVVAWHGSAGLFAYDLDGKELWRRDYGKFTHIWGNAASPILHGDHVIQHFGPGLSVLLVALNKQTGEEVWKRELPEAQSKDEKQFLGSWSTPVLRKNGDRQELLLSLPKNLRAFDPANGEDIWNCEGLTDLVYTSPIYGGDTVVAMSGYGGAAIAVDAPPGSKGDISDKQLWRVPRNPQRVGSGVVVGDHIYILNEPGIAECYDLQSGKSLWKERLDGASWSSMVHADGRLYIINMQGVTNVLEPSPDELKVISRNVLEKNEMTRASLALSDGQIFIRTYQHFYCVGKRTEK
jgi:outer membrane protein assembly factor BamB